MFINPGRLWVKLVSAQALRQYMEFRQETNRSLAAKAGVGPGIVGHLRSGKRTTCSPRVAQAIEEALACPPGFLFVPKLSVIQADAGRAVAA